MPLNTWGFGNKVTVEISAQGAAQAAVEIETVKTRALGLQALALKGFAIGAGAALGAKALRELGDEFGQAMQLAADFEQSGRAINTIFGESSDIIERFGRTADKAFGLSMVDVQQLATVVGAELKSLGFSTDEAARKTIELEARAADLAATFGGDTSDAIRAMSSLLRGERDPIEKYGISIKQADVNARVLALGLDTSTAAGKRNAEAIAALQLLMEQSSQTAGKFAESIGTVAGQQARLNAEIANLETELGTKALPLQKKWLELQRDTINVLSGVVTITDSANNSLEENFQAVIDASGALPEFVRRLALAGNAELYMSQQMAGLRAETLRTALAIEHASDSVEQFTKVVNKAPGTAGTDTHRRAGHRQHGGPVSANQPYIVGERQPEVFVPGTAGNILPSVPTASGGNTTIINVNGVSVMTPGSAEALARQLEPIITRAQMRRRPAFAA